jgi:hypothetical protein
MLSEAPPPRAGDHVHHGPTGETWVVRRVVEDRLEWLGWPPGQAKLSDCTTLYRCADEEHQETLKQIAQSGRSTLLTDEEITRELATRVMGWTAHVMPAPRRGQPPTRFYRRPNGMPKMAGDWTPLDNIFDAWEIRDVLAAHGRVQVANGYGVFDGCEFEPFTGGPPPYPFGQPGCINKATAPNAARAICLCALRAVGVDPEGEKP